MRKKLKALCILTGGSLEMEDLKSFKVHEEDAWTVPLGDSQMHLPPPPAGGALLAFILQIMKGLISPVMTINGFSESFV